MIPDLNSKEKGKIVSVIIWKFVLQKAGRAQLLTADPDQLDARFARLHPTP